MELVRCGIARIEPDAVVDTEGRRHPADVLIYATGFRVNDFLSSLRITGRDGADLHRVGATTRRLPRHHDPGLPELLLHVRTRHQPRQRRGLIFHSECEMRYITGCLDELIASGPEDGTRPDRYDD